ncbi:MAG: tetraacyldisaccharide 4'-kinase [Desulfobacteraceae bacterium]|nr:tetraacyldisaccharide 4'-kinase [Desulfobacteraceae bacterium]
MQRADRGRFFSPRTILAGLGAVYGGAMALRADLYRGGWLARRRLPCKVVSVGNLTLGGTGKTPLTMELARRIQAMGWRVAVVSRGYRGRAEDCGAVVSDGRRLLLSAAEAGDEPYLIARRLDGVPVVVGKDRWAAGMIAVERFSSQVVVLDDGFQHLRLARDLDLLLVDARAPMGNGLVFPGGRLREPPRAARRCHAVVRVSRGEKRGDEARTINGMADRPHFRLALKAYPVEVRFGETGDPPGTPAAAYLAGRRCVVFSGIADNARFFEDVGRLGGAVVASFGFRDHHPYRRSDLRRVLDAARQAGAPCLVTTAKDAVRLEAFVRLDLPLVVIDLEPAWSDGGQGIQAFLERRLGRRSPRT